jgi:hypothetical protein
MKVIKIDYSISPLAQSAIQSTAERFKIKLWLKFENELNK